MTLTLLIGGARSGKSSLAVDIGHRHHAAGMAVSYVATAPVIDDDMADRVARHREERPPEWTTVEEEVDLAGTFERIPDGLVIVDCLTLWTSNMMWRDVSHDEIDQRARSTAEAAISRDGPTVVVTNEVGLGIHPETDLGRQYRDVLGRVNQVWATAASTSLLLVAGRAIPLTDPWQFL